MNLFNASDYDKLVAPPEEFDDEHLRRLHDNWGNQRLRNAVALEVLAQIRQRARSDFLFKGGTLLQSRLGWPPPRASVDVDLETQDVDSIRQALNGVVQDFQATGITVTEPETDTPGTVFELVFPDEGRGPGYRARVDVLEYGNWPASTGEWNLPKPWSRCEAVNAPSKATQAAQKLMMFAAYPYGRNLDVDGGRKSMAKDLFDAVSLSQETLDAEAIITAAHEDVARKTDYMDTEFKIDDLIQSAQERLRFLAPARDVSADLVRKLWQDSSKVRSAIQSTFQDLETRIASGCCHHALGGILDGSLDWEDTWIPFNQRQPRRAWAGIELIQCHEAVDGSLEGIVGLREAWAKPTPT